jgi:hypothetical protein
MLCKTALFTPVVGTSYLGLRCRSALPNGSPARSESAKEKEKALKTRTRRLAGDLFAPAIQTSEVSPLCSAGVSQRDFAS